MAGVQGLYAEVCQFHCGLEGLSKFRLPDFEAALEEHKALLARHQAIVVERDELEYRLGKAMEVLRSLDHSFGCGHAEHGPDDWDNLVRHVDELIKREMRMLRAGSRHHIEACVEERMVHRCPGCLAQEILDDNRGSGGAMNRPPAPAEAGPLPLPFTNTDPKRTATSLAIGECAEDAKGLATDGNKPLMQSRAANDGPSAIGNPASDTFGRTASDTRRQDRLGAIACPNPGPIQVPRRPVLHQSIGGAGIDRTAGALSADVSPAPPIQFNSGGKSEPKLSACERQGKDKDGIPHAAPTAVSSLPSESQSQKPTSTQPPAHAG